MDTVAYLDKVRVLELAGAVGALENGVAVRTNLRLTLSVARGGNLNYKNVKRR